MLLWRRNSLKNYFSCVFMPGISRLLYILVELNIFYIFTVYKLLLVMFSNAKAAILIFVSNILFKSTQLAQSREMSRVSIEQKNRVFWAFSFINTSVFKRLFYKYSYNINFQPLQTFFKVW